MDEDFDLESLIHVEQTSASGLLMQNQILSQLPSLVSTIPASKMALSMAVSTV